MWLYYAEVVPKSEWLSGRIIRVNLYISEMRNIEQKMQWLLLKMSTGCPKNGVKLKIIMLGLMWQYYYCCWGTKKCMVCCRSIQVNLHISEMKNTEQKMQCRPLKISTRCPKNGVELNIILLGLMWLYYVVVAPKSVWLSGRVIGVNLYISEIMNIEK